MTRSRDHARVERDFYEALERLQAQQPRNPELRRRLQEKGKIKVNVANVAKEADRSRTLIGTERCRFPDVRQAILIAEQGIPTGRDTVLADLRRQVAELRTELRACMTEAKYWHKEHDIVLDRLNGLQARYERVKQKAEKQEHARLSGSVVNLFPEDQ